VIASKKSHSRCHTAVALGALTFLGSHSLAPSQVQAQDRALGLFADLWKGFSPKPARPGSALRSSFEKVIPESDRVAEELRESLGDRKLLKITCGDAATAKLQGAWEVQLADGTTLSLHPRLRPEFNLRKDLTITLSDSSGDYTIPVSAIRSIRPERDLLYDPDWNNFITEHAALDVILVRRSDGVLDRVEGLALKCTQTHLEFNYDGDVVHVPLRKIEGLRTKSSATNDKVPADPACAVVQTGANTIRCKELSVSDGDSPKLQVVTVAGATMAIELAPLVIDRTGTLALTARDLAVVGRRLPLEEWQLISQSPYRAPLAVPAEVLSVSGRGVDTGLTIQGPAEVDITIPKGYSRLYFELAIVGVPVAPVTFHYQELGSDSKVIYQQPRFPDAEHVGALRNELTLPGAGMLTIHVPGEARFTTFLLGFDTQ
jgi:hypothetical protein